MPDSFRAKTEAAVHMDIQTLMSGPVAAAKTQLSAQLDWRSLGKSEVELMNSAIDWALRAQQGTVDKLILSLPADRQLGSLELLALARNLFENLIWLKLFNREQRYGLVFCARFLAQQEEFQLSLIVKVEHEIELFEGFEAEESRNLREAFAGVIPGKTPEALVTVAREEHDRLTAELDNRARREFAMFAASARYNGYGLQARILRDRVLPNQTEVLDKIRGHMARFEPLRTSLAEPYLTMTGPRYKWNWKERSDEVGLQRQFAFLYGYTSRLLHSTPMNLTTEPDLTEDERILMLEYVYVTILDLLDEIEAFDFPGKMQVLVLGDDDC